MSDEEGRRGIVSRSHLKRESHALVALGEELVKLSKGQLSTVPLSERLAEAIGKARSIKAHGGRKRQLKFVGKLLRDSDVEGINAALDRIRDRSVEQVEEHHELEGWRERLLAEGDSAINELLSEHPSGDRQHLRQLIRNALHEREAGKPPRSFRLLFRYLRVLFEGGELQ